MSQVDGCREVGPAGSEALLQLPEAARGPDSGFGEVQDVVQLPDGLGGKPVLAFRDGRSHQPLAEAVAGSSRAPERWLDRKWIKIGSSDLGNRCTLEGVERVQRWLVQR